MPWSTKAAATVGGIGEHFQCALHPPFGLRLARMLAGIKPYLEFTFAHFEAVERLPVERGGWRFKIDQQHNEIRITPSADNGLRRPALLATVHTCDNLLHLPTWESAEELAEGMAASVKYGGGFGTH